MTGLKLRTFEELDHDPDVYPFPRHEPGPGSADFDDSDVDSLDLAQRIEATLDQLQLRLDQVKDELDAVYRFPSPEDIPPVAA